MTIAKKRCGRCGHEYPLDGFHRNHKNKDGRNSVCKVCKKAYMDAYVERPEVAAREATRYRTPQYRAAKRAWKKTPHGRAVVLAANRRCAARRPAWYKALSYISAQARAGKIERPTRCKCGHEGTLWAEFSDPARPHDDLEFLCAQCKSKRRRARAVRTGTNITPAEWHRIHAANMLKAEREYGPPDRRFALDADFFRVHFAEIRVDAAPPPQRYADRMLACAIGAHEHPAWEPDYE